MTVITNLITLKSERNADFVVHVKKSSALVKCQKATEQAGFRSSLVSVSRRDSSYVR